MIATDEDSLICDLAETYHIFDYRALPVKLLATLCLGLREDSRIKMSLSGASAPNNLLLLASAVDELRCIAWALTSGDRNNPPESLVSSLLGIEQKDNGNNIRAYNSSEEFEAEYRKLKEGGTNG